MAHGDTRPLGRPFWTLWTSFTATNLADGFAYVAMPLLAIRLTGDARWIAAVTAFQYLPFLVVGLPAGTLIDRFDRRWIAVFAQTARGSVMALLGIALLSGRPAIGWLFLVAFLDRLCRGPDRRWTAGDRARPGPPVTSSRSRTRG